MMTPAVGVRNFVSRLKKVVLPAPLGPISAWMEPRCTLRLTSLTAIKPLKPLVRFLVSSMTSLVIECLRVARYLPTFLQHYASHSHECNTLYGNVLHPFAKSGLFSDMRRVRVR